MLRSTLPVSVLLLLLGLLAGCGSSFDGGSGPQGVPDGHRVFAAPDGRFAVYTTNRKITVVSAEGFQDIQELPREAGYNKTWFDGVHDVWLVEFTDMNGMLVRFSYTIGEDGFVRFHGISHADPVGTGAPVGPYDYPGFGQGQ